MIIKLKDRNIIEQAATLIRDKFKIDLNITQCSIEAGPAFLSIDPQLKIESIVVKNHGDGWIERVDLSYLICGRDLEDGSLIDELIGGDLKKCSPNMRQVLRLAFILYDGVRYGLRGNHKKAYMDKGWLPRVSVIQRQSYTK